MNHRTATSYYARQSATAQRELGAVRAEAQLLRDLLSETDSRLRQAWDAGKLPAGILPDDLIERTRAALSGDQSSRQMTVSEIAGEAVRELAKLNGHRC